MNDDKLEKDFQAIEGEIVEEELQAEAVKMLQSPTLLFDILSEIKRLNVVGEEKNLLLLYLVGTSRITDEPLSGILKAESAAGKSYETARVFKLFPPEGYLELTDATAQSFYHAPKDYFAHKIIIIFERHGQEKTDYSIRSLQSENKLKLQITIKDKETSQFKTVVKEVDGPAGFITTTTEPRLNRENETRDISIYVDESVEQTTNILDELGKKYQGIEPISDEELKKWQMLQKVLQPYPVIIPFVEELSRHFPKKPTRVRRDYTKLLTLISVSTILHREQRKKVELKGRTFLNASIADFHLVKVIFEETLAKTIFELPPKSEEIVKKVKELYPVAQFSISDLTKPLNWDYDTVKKWFDPAFKNGFFNLVEEHKGSRPAKYELSGKKLENISILPTVEKLYEKNPSWLVGNLYDPLTGENKILKTLSSGQSSGQITEPKVSHFEPKSISTDAPTQKEGDRE